MSCLGVNSTAEGFSVKDSMTDDSFFNISEIKLTITSLFPVQIMSYLGVSDIIHSDVIDSFFSKIFKKKSWILASWCKRSWTVRFTPLKINSITIYFVNQERERERER